jgi:subtilisin family serine protease
LLASGTIPFSGNDVSINGTPLRSGYGTSYAAPRVAGMVAIVRSKFPNLSANQTASIMLDTARYDTLTCYPACNPAIYGKGEASLSRALSPVGKLR